MISSIHRHTHTDTLVIYTFDARLITSPFLGRIQHTLRLCTVFVCFNLLSLDQLHTQAKTYLGKNCNSVMAPLSSLSQHVMCIEYTLMPTEGISFPLQQSHTLSTQYKMACKPTEVAYLNVHTHQRKGS